MSQSASVRGAIGSGLTSSVGIAGAVSMAELRYSAPMAKATHRAPQAKPRAPKASSKANKKPAPAQRPKRAALDVEHWGTPSEGATRFALRALLPGQPSRKCGLPGQSGVIDYHWKLDRFSTEWVRQHFGPGRYQAEWLGVRPHPKSRRPVLGSLGKSKQVDILAHASPAPSRAAGGLVVQSYPEQAPAPAAIVRSEEEIDRRVAVERELGELRLKHERDMAKARQELDHDRVKLD